MGNSKFKDLGDAARYYLEVTKLNLECTPQFLCIKLLKTVSRYIPKEARKESRIDQWDRDMNHYYTLMIDTIRRKYRPSQ